MGGNAKPTAAKAKTNNAAAIKKLAVQEQKLRAIANMLQDLKKMYNIK